MTNFPSCVARRLLFHLILNCDHKTTLPSYEAHICVEHLHQIRGDEAIKDNWTIVESSKSGSGSILLYYESKSRRAHGQFLSRSYTTRWVVLFWTISHGHELRRMFEFSIIAADSSDLESSDLENSDLENSDLENSDPLKNDWDFKGKSTWTTIVVTSSKPSVKSSNNPALIIEDR